MKNLVPGAAFRARKNIFRPTAMSMAMATAGIIPAPHIINERAVTGVLRHKQDQHDILPSVVVAL